jgi:hypothetical protein
VGGALTPLTCAAFRHFGMLKASLGSMGGNEGFWSDTIL